MQVKYLTASVIAALALNVHAEVTVGGFLQAEVAYNKDQTNSDGKQDFYTGVYDVGSSIDVKGSHDVTSTGKLQWQVSTFLTKDEIAPPSLGWVGDRKLYVRWADSFGTVTLGRDDSPIRMAFAPYDIFNGWASLGTVFDRSSYSRPSHQVKYVSPKIGGLTVRAAGQFGTTDGTSEPDRGYYASAAYDLNKMFGFDFGYSNESDRGDIQGKDRDAWLAGVRGEIASGLTYGVLYVNAKSWAGQGEGANKNWMIGENVQYVVGNHTVRGGHVYADNSEANLFLLGYEYALPEVAMGNTKLGSALYVEASYIDNPADSDIAQGFKASTMAGTDPLTLAAGVYVSF